MERTGGGSTTEIAILVADLVGDDRFDDKLRFQIDPAILTADGGRRVLEEAERRVVELRVSDPSFRQSTHAHPDSYWPIVVLLRPDLDLLTDVFPENTARHLTPSGALSFDVEWNYGVVASTGWDEVHTIFRIATQTLAHWSRIRESIEATRRTMADLMDSHRISPEQARQSLRAQQLTLFGSLLNADQRVNCVWEYEARFLTAMSRAWDLEQLEESAQRTTDAASAHLQAMVEEETRRQTEQTQKGVATVRQLLLALALIGGLGTAFAIIEFAANPTPIEPGNLVRLILVLVATIAVAGAFRTLRNHSTIEP